MKYIIPLFVAIAVCEARFLLEEDLPTTTSLPSIDNREESVPPMKTPLAKEPSLETLLPGFVLSSDDRLKKPVEQLMAFLIPALNQTVRVAEDVLKVLPAIMKSPKIKVHMVSKRDSGEEDESIETTSETVTFTPTETVPGDKANIDGEDGSEDQVTTLSPEARDSSLFFPLAVIQADQLGSESVSVNKSLPAPSLFDILFPSDLMANDSMGLSTTTETSLDEDASPFTTDVPESIIERSRRVLGSLLELMEGGAVGDQMMMPIMPLDGNILRNPIMG